jgi:hypothetical protein
MKPFNLRDALVGKPVCTREGLHVRIFCADLKDDERPLVGAVTRISGEGPDSPRIHEEVRWWTVAGRAMTGPSDSPFDLFMATRIMKREGWMNRYPPEAEGPYLLVYEALKDAADAWDYSKEGAPVKVTVTWEE